MKISNKIDFNIDPSGTGRIISSHSLRDSPFFFLIINFESILDYPYLVRMMLI